MRVERCVIQLLAWRLMSPGGKKTEVFVREISAERSGGAVASGGEVASGEGGALAASASKVPLLLLLLSAALLITRSVSTRLRCTC